MSGQESIDEIEERLRSKGIYVPNSPEEAAIRDTVTLQEIRNLLKEILSHLRNLDERGK